MNNYRHVIWDWNGTIFNDVKLCVNIINGLLSKRNLKTLTLEDYRRIFTFPVKEYYRIAGFDFEKESFEVVGKEWMDQYESRKLECSVFEDVRRFISDLNSNGIGQSILSAYSQHTLLELAEHFQIKDFFSHIVGLDHIYADSKLHLGKELINKIDVDTKNILLIGDTLHDFDVAEELGVDCFLIASGHQEYEKLNESGVAVFNSAKELLELYRSAV